MNQAIQENCELCGGSQHDRPLVTLTFRGETVFLCVQCMPQACKGLDWAALAETLRARRSQDLDRRPLARPGLRY